MKKKLTFPSEKVSLLTAATALFFLLCSCQFIPNDDVARFGTDRKYPDLNYTGDGNFTDYGRKAGILRFVLDLEEVDLKKENLREFELKGLPEVKFVCYLRVDHPLPTLGKPKNFGAADSVVEMSLEDENGTKVFSEKAPLTNWVWSGSVGAPQSVLYTHKTIFTPEKDKSFRLSLKIRKGNPDAPQAQLLLMGGGWKAF
tara:strand:- start:367 stop:966 length:600 start_codon:yes stop_codon:yes gene_type:complete